MKEITVYMAMFFAWLSGLKLVPVRSHRPRRDRGFTITELLIAVFITAVISTAVYSVYTNYYRQSTTQDMVLEAQQNARVAINMMERELVNAGYASDDINIVSEASTNALTFKYTDPSEAAMSATAGQLLEVRYALQTVSGVQYLTRKADVWSGGVITVTGTTEKVVPYAKNMTFTYYDLDGNVLTPATQADRNNIRFITVNLVTETKDIPQGATARRSFTVETHVRLRNIGIGQAATDTTAPAAPSTPEVRDPGVCGRLTVRWTENTEGDVLGYNIYYATTTAPTVWGRIQVPLTALTGSSYSCTRSGGTMTCTIFPSSPSPELAFSSSDGATSTTYIIGLIAYDGTNISPMSSTVSNDPSPTSYASFGGGTLDDTTINPVKPPAVTGFTATDGGADGQVALSWDAYDTTGNPDVEGFRIYRSASPFGSFPIVPSASITLVADEPGGSTLNPINAGTSSFTDTSGSLLGCSTYYYAIAPVNCDTTLVTDDAGDDDTKRYVQADYGATCGDGTSACSPGGTFPAVAGSDTAPPDSGAPDAPANFDTRAGWKRVAISFDQPGLATSADLKQTCIYSIESGSYPTLQTSTDAFGCYDVDTPGIRLFESDGVFDTAEVSHGATHSFWHNSMTALTSTPSLQETGTYSYRAVAFDMCGNASDPADAQATTTLCGEDPAGKPPAVTGLSGGACGGNPETVSLSWTEVSSDIASPSSATNPWDLAGYRVFRATTDDAAGWGSSVLLTGAPLWGSTLSDSGTTDGGTYYYRVVSTDCPYEKGDDTGGSLPTDAEIRSHMISGFLSSMKVGPYNPGRIGRDEKCADTVSPAVSTCAKDDHREVLTGVDVNNTAGNGSGASTPGSAYTHDTVTVFFENTSAGTMTITGADVSWVNSAAFLSDVTIGGGRSGVGTTTTSIAAGLTTSVTGNPPYTSAVLNATLSSAVINANARYVPITFQFEDSGGDPVDMREDQLLITLDVTNNSTGTSTCATYLTISGAADGIAVPRGPELTSVQQDNPSSPTFAFSVPGASGAETVPTDGSSYGSIEATGGADVTVSANVISNTTDPTTGSKVAISSATLYWVETDLTVGTAPSSGYTAATMTNSGGNIWSGTVPARDTTTDPKRVWYYVVGVDADGNFDRSPEVDEGAYTYDQKPFDPCDVTPDGSAYLQDYLVADTYVQIRWPQVTTYTNGNTINTTLDPITYQVWRRSTLAGSFTKVYEVKDSHSIACVWANVTADTPAGAPTAPATASYQAHCPGTPELFYWWDNVDALANDLTYYVVAANSCSPDPNTGTKTNDYRECRGAADAVISVAPSTADTASSYTVTVNDCGKSGGAIDSVTVNNIATIGSINYSVVLTEGATNVGLFTGTVTTTDVMGESASKVYVSPSDTVDDTVTVSCTGCTGTPTSQTVTVSTQPCDFTPAAPTGLAGVKAGADIDLTWTANAEGDIVQYKIYRDTNGGGYTFLDTVAVGTTAYSDRPFQINSNDYSYRITAVDSCSTPNESAASSTVGPY